VRGCLTLIIGLIAGAGLMLAWWPKQPSGTVSPRAADLRVTISDAYLARTVQARVAGYSVPQVRHVRVASLPGVALVVSADLTVGPLSAPASVEMQPYPANGQVQVRIISTRVAGIPIPSQLTGVIADAIDSSARGLMDRHAHVTGVTVTPTGIQLSANYA
jgi:hypothetical protein